MSKEEIERADAMHKTDDVKGNFELIEKLYNDGNQSSDVSWRLCRACYDMAQETSDKDEKKKFVERGLELIKSALEQDPSSFTSHKWYGIMLGSHGDFIPTKEKIANAYIIRDSFLKAIELNPTDGTCQYCMGKWCWNVLQIGWVERQAASLLFGTPPSSTYEECEKYLLKSTEIDPSQAHTLLLLGDLYYQQKQWEKAKEWFSKAIDRPVQTENQRRQHEEAKTKLGKC